MQEIRIQPYFCVKQGDYFFPLFSKDPVFENPEVANKLYKSEISKSKISDQKGPFYRH